MTETRSDVRADVTTDARLDGASGGALITTPRPTPRPTGTARTVGRVIIAGLFAYCGCNAAMEAWSEARDIVMHAPEPLPGILLFQSAVFLTSALSAIGTWRRASWAPRAVTAWGTVGSVFVSLLQPMLGLPLAALPGLLVGAALLIAMAAGVVAFLRRDTPVTSASTAPIHDRQERM